MMLLGRLSKETATCWEAWAPAAGVYTQGRSRKDAAAKLADAFESLIRRPGFKVTVIDENIDEKNEGLVFIEANNPAALAAYVLKYQRKIHGLSLAQATKALGTTSRNAYAQYEQGASVLILDKFVQLLHAVAPEVTLVIEILLIATPRPRHQRLSAPNRRAKSPTASRRRRVR